MYLKASVVQQNVQFSTKYILNLEDSQNSDSRDEELAEEQVDEDNKKASYETYVSLLNIDY